MPFGIRLPLESEVVVTLSVLTCPGSAHGTRYSPWPDCKGIRELVAPRDLPVGRVSELVVVLVAQCDGARQAIGEIGLNVDIARPAVAFEAARRLGANPEAVGADTEDRRRRARTYGRIIAGLDLVGLVAELRAEGDVEGRVRERLDEVQADPALPPGSAYRD